MAIQGRLWQLLVLGVWLMMFFALGGTAGAVSPSDSSRRQQGEFYTPAPNKDGVRQVAMLRSQGRKADAALLSAMLDTPTAVWVESGMPAEAERQVRRVTTVAAAKRAIPVLVLYNIPFRDCAQYSAGGATSAAEYKAWIDGVARGIGNREAFIVVEPDGLGIIPWYTTINGQLEWCQPAEAEPATAAAERFEMLNYAVDTLKALPKTSVYLDGTHDGWLGVGDISDRLIKAGVTRADGFFLNASNYRWTDRLVKYGSWIAQCIHLDQNSWFQRGWCGSQYYPASPGDFSTWALTDQTYDKAYADTGLARDWEAMPHFIIDTSRNGQGPWTPPAGAYPDPQDWCNPPERGLGLRPTLDTGHELVDAFVWIKVPGESDGQCSRGLGSGNNVVDPVWGRVDPAAGAWFPEQALQLAKLANPPLR
jgi:endoglucanase